MDPQLIEQILAVIRSTESGGNYQAVNGSETRDKAASGAYQMIGSTWRSWAAASGVPGATQYFIAADAPPQIQDAVARWAVGRYDSPEAVWGNWYYPAGYASGNWDMVPPGANRLTIRQYINLQNSKLNSGNYDITPDQAMASNPAPSPSTPMPQNVFGAGNTALRGSQQVTQPPDGGFLINVDGQTKIVYNLGPNVDVFFDIDPSMNWNLNNTPWALAPNITSADVSRSGWVHGGSASELGDVTGDLKAWIDQQINILLGGNTEAAKDPEVRKIFLDWAVNPEISEAEVQARLRQTSYWQTHTQSQLDWNDLSPADQQSRINDEAAKLVSMYVDQVGENISESDPTLRQWAMDVASGKRTEQSVLLDIRRVAESRPGSPWVQQTHQRENLVDQQRGAIEKMYQDWGLPVSPDTLNNLANQLASGEMSEQDLLDSMDTMASGLYAGKPKGMPTRTWADPYLQTYQNLLEVPDPGLFNPEIQNALTSGLTLGDFQKQLMLKPQWANTRNGKDTLMSAALKLGKQIGFA